MALQGYVKTETLAQVTRNLRKEFLSKARKVQINTEILSGDKTFATHQRIGQFLDPGGANRDVFLPPVFTLDGSPWLQPVECQNCDCDGGHIFKKPFPTDLYFHIYNTADGAEDLVLKFKKETWVTASTECATGKYHDTPTSKTGENEYAVMTISQNEGGVVFCNGIIWRGFVAGIT